MSFSGPKHPDILWFFSAYTQSKSTGQLTISRFLIPTIY